jgi:hypothetical protein
MLFMVTHKHSAEMCPGGSVKPDKQFMTKLQEGIEKNKVKLIAGYHHAPSHEFWFIIAAEDVESLNNAVWQLALVGEVRTVPVLNFAESVGWTKQIGIQQ